MRIFLIGLTGCGKTTIGKSLAYKLNLTFVDVDEVIEIQEEMKISEIFATHDEEYFRILESRKIRELCKLKDAVISTGGGAACFYDNMTIMNVSGVTIFLDVPIETICTRLYNQMHKNTRPMIANKTYDELFIFLQSLYDLRIEYYNEAKVIVKGSDISAAKILDELDSLD